MNRLINNLNLLVETHQSLLEVLHQEEEIPPDCTLDELNAIHEQRDQFSARIAKLESERLKIIAHFGDKDQSVASISLKEIIAAWPPENRQELSGLREELKSVIDRIIVVGKKNAVQATARMACFNEIQGSLNRVFKRSPTYSMYGTLKNATGTNLVRKSI